jgi:hypothetical protein
MLQMIMLPKLPNMENIGLGEKYIKWLFKSYIYKNMDEETILIA